MSILFGFRKLLLALVFVIITLVLLYLQLITGEIWANANRDVVVAFLGANLVSKVIKSAKEVMKNAKKKKK